MRLLSTILTIALASDAVLASSSWFGGSAPYSNWQESERKRWLTDNSIPYSKSANKKELGDLIEKNWDAYAVAPYKNWDTTQLNSYLKLKGVQVKDAAASNKDYLVSQVASNWYETEDKAQAAWDSTKDWIVDTWSDSVLKAFADKHGIPVPQPTPRDTVLQKIRASYQSLADKAGDISYPGDWLYDSWTESDFKAWLDKHGFPAPQPTSRDKLVASVRRNSRLAYLKYQEQLASASASANAVYDTLLDTWGESQLLEFADKNGIKVPHNSKAQEIRALIRKHRAEFLGDTLSASAASGFGAATSKAGNQYAKATDDASLASQEAFGKVVNTWSNSKLKDYLDARGVPVPQASNTDKLRALVLRNSHKAAVKYNTPEWDQLSYDNLKSYLANSGNNAAKKVGESSSATRDELVSAAKSAYASASSAGGDSYASATSYLTKATGSAKSSAFETWSESDLKDYLDSYGVPVPQGSTVNQLKAEARKQYTYFKYGTTNPADTAFAKFSESVKDTYQWVITQLGIGAGTAKEKADNVRKEL